MAEAAKATNVVHLRKLTAVEDPQRPFRLWDAKKRKQLRYRYYGAPKRAQIAALIECRWSSVGTTIEVYDARNGHLLGQYTRTPTNISFMR